MNITRWQPTPGRIVSEIESLYWGGALVDLREAADRVATAHDMTEEEMERLLEEYFQEQ